MALKSNKNTAQTVNSEFIEKTVQIRRVTKVVKGGRRFGFSALVVIGDGKGKVGYGMGKANEVSEAIKKASRSAQKTMVSLTTYNSTIPHMVTGKYCSGEVLMRPMAPGSGIIASAPIRAVIEALGLSDINAKSMRSSNPINLVKATFNGFSKLRSFEDAARLRAKPIEHVNSIEY